MNKSLNRVQEAFLRLVRNQAWTSAHNALKQMHPADLAILLPYLQTSEQKWFAKTLLECGKLSGVLSELDENAILQLSEMLTEDQLVRAMQEMDPDDAADLIIVLPEEQRTKVFDRLSGTIKHTIGKLLGHAPDTAGGIMTTELLSFPETLTVQEAVAELRRRGKEKSEEMFTIYVIGENEQLVGTVNFRDLVLSATDQTLKEIMTSDPVVVRAHANQEFVADMIARYNLLSVPVVDEHHRLIGRVTVDDAIDVLKEEATEDIYRLANLGKEDHVSTPVLTSTRRRLPWLLVNLLTGLLAAATVSFFSETISSFVVLAVLMPIVAGMGGNAGTQSLTVVVRSLALGEVDWSLGWTVLLKEIGVGLFNGLVVGVVMAGIAFAWYQNLTLSGIMFFAMVMNLIIAGLFGAVVPLVLRKLKLDPALGSSVLVTTATDVGGFFVFLGLASLLIQALV